MLSILDRIPIRILSACATKQNNIYFVLQIPRAQVVEKQSRVIERQAIEMDRKNRTYTLLEDSDSDGESVREKQKVKKKDKEKDRGNKRKHIRKKKESESSSEEEMPKR